MAFFSARSSDTVEGRKNSALGLLAFLDQVLKANNPKAEFFLPSTVSELLAEKKATVKVLHSPDKWYGVTYAADKEVVVAAMKRFASQGLYPEDGLWSR